MTHIDSPLSFAKMNGAANDFVLITGAPPVEPEVGELVRRLCHRRRGIGGDGVLFMERLHGFADDVFHMHFYNCDGGRAQLCLNGARCCVRRAVQLGWAEGRFSFRTDVGSIEGELVDANQVALWVQPPERPMESIQLPPNPWASVGHPVFTGDEHLVIEVSAEALRSMDLVQAARPLREWTGAFARGNNVHFVHRDGREWTIRTYERGVEAETWASGSGCMSAVAALGTDGEEIRLRTHGGDEIRIARQPGRWQMIGPTQLACEGQAPGGGIQ